MGGTQPSSGEEEYKLLEILHEEQDKPGANGVDIAYSADASMMAIATEDKRVRVWRTGRVAGLDSTDEECAKLEPGTLLGEREIPKKPTSILFSPTRPGGDGGGGGGAGVEKGEVKVCTRRTYQITSHRSFHGSINFTDLHHLYPVSIRHQ